MSSEQDKVRELAARVARRLADAPAPPAAGSLQAALAEIQRRLAHIESHLTHDEDCAGDAGRANARGEASTRPVSPSPARQGGGAGGAAPSRSMWLSGTYVPAGAHPSQERFGSVGEAVSEMVEFFEGEKTCNIEPGGKPCDHCGVCSSRGF
jgi:hypothetical protein